MENLAENSEKSAPAKDGTNRGGKRPGAGRPPGSKNRAAFGDRATLSALARTYTTEAVEVLRSIMMDPAAPESSRITAASTLLDRGYGKVAQQVAVPVGDDAIELAAETEAVRSSRLLAGLIGQINGAVDQAHYQEVQAMPVPEGGPGGEVVDAEFGEIGPDPRQDADTPEDETAENSQSDEDPLTRATLF